MPRDGRRPVPCTALATPPILANWPLAGFAFRCRIQSGAHKNFSRQRRHGSGTVNNASGLPGQYSDRRPAQERENVLDDFAEEHLVRTFGHIPQVGG
jgi:hypothetical protein